MTFRNSSILLASLAVVCIAICGCAGTRGGSPQHVAMGSVRPAEPTGFGSRVTGAVSSVTTKVASVFSPKKRVVEAEDPIDLDTKTEDVGPEIYLTAGNVHESQGNWDQAKQQYERALSEDPTNFAALVSIARIHDRKGEYADAADVYRMAIKHHPTNAQGYHDLGICHSRHGDMNNALSMIDRAIQLDPENVRFRNNMATLLIREGDTDTALSHLTAVHPPAAAHYNAGVLLHQQKRIGQAEAQFELALQHDPELHAARGLLAQLQQQGATVAQGSAEDDETPIFNR